MIDAVATRLGLPVVVNVSQGMNAGAHDGKSELEVAFDAFTSGGRKPGRVVVKSAGNERQKHGHAMLIVNQDRLEKLRWVRDPGASRRERMELWWNSADELEFRLVDPAGNETPWFGTSAPPPAEPFPGGIPVVNTSAKSTRSRSPVRSSTTPQRRSSASAQLNHDADQRRAISRR